MLKNATKVSAYCSTAFKVLSDDVSRAKYILKQEHGIDALEEGEREKDQSLMEWVFETRMEIEQADSTMELAAMLIQIKLNTTTKSQISQCILVPQTSIK